jgi:hypothetical protein
VRSLRRQLLALGGRPQESAGDAYDTELTLLVEEFQRTRRLSVDGVATVLTQVAIDAARSSPGAPVLAGP